MGLIARIFVFIVVVRIGCQALNLSRRADFEELELRRLMGLVVLGGI